MTDTSAVPGSSSIFDSFEKLTDRPVIKKKTTQQSKIAALANSDNWKAVQEMIDIWVKELGQITLDPKKDTVESIGFRYLASRVTIEYLQDLRNMPERYKKMMEVENETENRSK